MCATWQRHTQGGRQWEAQHWMCTMSYGLSLLTLLCLQLTHQPNCCHGVVRVSINSEQQQAKLQRARSETPHVLCLG